MKDEINIKMPGQILDYVDTKEHLLDLFNYITNLQEEIERQSKAQVILDNQITEMYDYKSRNEKAVEIYKNRNTCKYKKERFMKDKSTSDLMYETLIGGDE